MRQKVEEFDRTWRFPVAKQADSGTDVDGSPPSPSDTTVAASTSQELGTIVAKLPIDVFPKSPELVSWSMVDGILMIHQGGGGIAFVHAFQDVKRADAGTTSSRPMGSAEKSSVIWLKRESEMVAAPRTWENPPHYGDIDYAFLRPFPPITSCNRQFAIFSTPYAVIAIPLAELPGWSSHGKIQPRVWLDLGYRPQADFFLAAPPVVIPSESAGHERSRQLLGLLLAKRTEHSSSRVPAIHYYWHVIDLSEQAIAKTDLSDTDELIPLEGEPCQIHRLSDFRFLLATQNGIWFANLYSDTGRIQNCRNLWSCKTPRAQMDPSRRSETTQLLLDQHVLRRNNLIRQNLLVLKDQIAKPHALQRVTVWHRAETASGTLRLQCFSFNCQISAGRLDINGENLLEFPSIVAGELSPLSQGRYRKREAAYFLAGQHGELRCCPHGEQTPQTISVGFSGDVSELKGIQVFDPLVVFVVQVQQAGRARSSTSQSKAGSDPGSGFWSTASINPDERLIRLRTLADPKSLATPIKLASLEVDPLFWLSSMFVCERESKGFLVIRRFDLRVVSHDESKIPQPIPPSFSKH